MSIFVPLLVLITCFTVVVTLLYHNLKRLDREAGEAWQRVQEERFAHIEAAEKLVSLAALDAAHTSSIQNASAACRAADGPSQAAQTDSVFIAVWHDLSSHIDTPSLSSCKQTRTAAEALHTIHEQLLTKERLYNNSATLYNNAGVTFPLLLIAKRVHFTARALYQPIHMRGATTNTSDADEESLAEKSPRIMNAYMLWAVGMSDMTMEEAHPAPPVMSKRA